MRLSRDNLTNVFIVCSYCRLMQHTQLADIMTATWTPLTLHVPQKVAAFSDPVLTNLIDLCL